MLLPSRLEEKRMMIEAALFLLHSDVMGMGVVVMPRRELSLEAPRYKVPKIEHQVMVVEIERKSSINESFSALLHQKLEHNIWALEEEIKVIKGLNKPENPSLKHPRIKGSFKNNYPTCYRRFGRKKIV